MSSKSEESEDGAGEEDLDNLEDNVELELDGDEATASAAVRSLPEDDEFEEIGGLRSAQVGDHQAQLNMESDGGLALEEVSSTTHERGHVEENGSVDDTLSIPDDTPSIQGSGMSSPGSSTVPLRSPNPRRSPTSSHRPFDRRFQTRLSSSPLNSPRAISPAFLGTHSRQSSVATIASQRFQTLPEVDPSEASWEVIRWTKLRKLTGQAFSEVGKRNFGQPTCITVSASIVLGTTKGIILVFDYQQNNKAIIGLGTKAVECGSVTSLAISADHTSVAAGHANGDIFTWEIARPARPFLHIQPLDLVSSPSRKSDGHIAGAAVLHVGFLGTRHTAVVSADDHGMAFSHLAVRGMGVVARNVRVTRILGRYPDAVTRTTKSRKPSSVLAFSPLPLGNVEQSTDSMGLVAMLTPYLLVIVSTTPVAQTQYKAARPKEVAAHGAMSAALAWFPAIKVKAPDATVSKTKLVYCWSNVLTVLEVCEVRSSDPVDKDKPPSLEFGTRSKWTSEETIVAVQWLSRSVLSVLTITQQLLILEANSMRLTDSFDLVQKHMYHADLFSKQLHALVEQLDEEDSSMHGVVADAFYMSFRSYKGKLFLLGHNDVAIGSLSNWADRLLALMEAGDFIGAIRLATSYYSGEGERLAIGLPEETEARQSVVKEKLLEMISASTKYAFGKNQEASGERLEESQLEDLATACIAASVSVGDSEFLFDEVYSWYDEYGMQNVFLDVLEPYIINGEVTSLPPAAVKALIGHFITNHSPSRLEEIICLLDTSTMDIDQVTSLCKKHNLFDAFIYVWNQTIGDYTGPLEELLAKAYDQTNGDLEKRIMDQNNASKLFPYLSYILTGRTYPTGEQMTDEESLKAKTQTYTFLFSGNADMTSRNSPKTAHSAAKRTPETSFPHLKTILSFDTASFMSVLNEGFEDSFLNDGSENHSNGTSKMAPSNSASHSLSVNRQYITKILLEVMSTPDFGNEDTIFLDMFIARNIPKYPQYILLSGTTLHQILRRLCEPPNNEMAEDCQLSVEYLLSIYHPPDIQSLLPLFKENHFFRVLKSMYRTERQFAKLLGAYLEDSKNQEEIYDCIRYCFRVSTNLSRKQLQEVRSVMEEHALRLIAIDVRQTALIIEAVASDLHQVFLDALDDESEGQYQYLEAILGPDARLSERSHSSTRSRPAFVERYLRLMCRYQPSQVASYVESIGDSDIQLKEVLPAMEDSGIIDAAVILLARQGRVRDGMDRLIKHIGNLEAVLVGIVESSNDSPDAANTDEAITDLLESLTRYSMVGVWLCQGQTKSANKSRGMVKLGKRGSAAAQQPLSFEEHLWLDLVDTVVRIARTVSPVMAGKAESQRQERRVMEQDEKISSSLRTLVQRVFTALLAATTTRDRSGERMDFSFLRILRAFLTRAAASSPSMSELRAVIASVFSAYAYEESLLELANSMLDKDLFVHVGEIAQLRQRGWRPRGQMCEVCRRRVWGPGAGNQIWEAWERKTSADRGRREERQKEQGDDGGTTARGKGRAADEHGHEPGDAAAAEDEVAPAPGEAGGGGDVGPIVVFSCRHVYHQRCLGKAPRGHEEVERNYSPGEGLSCPACAPGVPA